MATRGDSVDSSGFIVRDEVDELFGEANPNPERTGCPSQDVLSALAQRARPIRDRANRIADVLEDPLAQLHEVLGCRRHPDSPADSQEERLAEFFFEQRNLTRDR